MKVQDLFEEINLDKTIQRATAIYHKLRSKYEKEMDVQKRSELRDRMDQQKKHIENLKKKV
jgi:hypothetical protein